MQRKLKTKMFFLTFFVILIGLDDNASLIKKWYYHPRWSFNRIYKINVQLKWSSILQPVPMSFKKKIVTQCLWKDIGENWTGYVTLLNMLVANWRSCLVIHTTLLRIIQSVIKSSPHAFNCKKIWYTLYYTCKCCFDQ